MLTNDFFRDDKSIDAKRAYLELAIRSWILENGSPSCVTAPLRFGEDFVFALPFADGTIQTGLIAPAGDHMAFPRKNNLPWYDNPYYKGVTAVVTIESVDGSRAGSPILAGDSIRITASKTKRTLTSGSGEGSEVFILHSKDDPRAPSRMGEYFSENDEITFYIGKPGAPQKSMQLYYGAGGGGGPIDFTYMNLGRPFSLKRCDPSED